MEVKLFSNCVLIFPLILFQFNFHSLLGKETLHDFNTICSIIIFLEKMSKIPIINLLCPRLKF